MFKRAFLVVAAAAGSLAYQATAQQAQPDTAVLRDQLVQKLIDFTGRFRDRVPSLVCDESIVSQELRKGAVRKEVRSAGTLRVMRDESKPMGFTDQRRTVSLNGVPLTEGQHFKWPYFVHGVFPGALGRFRPELNSCFTFSARTEEKGESVLEFSALPGAEKTNPLCKDTPAGYRKIVRFDGEGNVLHIQRSMDVKAAHHLHDTPYSEVDYGPVQLGGRTVWVPQRSLARDDDDNGQMTATYSNFHLFSGNARIVSVGPEGAGGPPVP